MGVANENGIQGALRTGGLSGNNVSEKLPFTCSGPCLIIREQRSNKSEKLELSHIRR